MPHLSPMSWLLTLMTLWLLIMILILFLFYSKPSTLIIPKYLNLSSQYMMWPWL